MKMLKLEIKSDHMTFTESIWQLWQFNFFNFNWSFSSTYIYNAVVSQALFDDVYVIFPIHLNFPIRSRCILKVIIHEKDGIVDCFTVTW